jgi:polysaccharide pyruvyl transferase CsaB
MKYVVSGYIGFDNFGDEAIAHVLSQKLKSLGAEKITLISSNPEKTSELHGVCSCGMLNFLPALMESDVLISGGGSLLQDVTSLKSLLYYLCVIYTALISGKEVQIYAQGIGPIKSTIGRVLTRFALSKVRKISVRDKKSQELLANWGIASELVKDPIFELELPQKNSKGIVGIQLRKFQGINEEFLERLAENVGKNFSDKKIQIISLQDSIDLEICEQFALILKDKGIKNAEVLSELSLRDVTETISNLEYLISMRFHAIVVGIVSGVRTLAINYDPKVEKVAQEYNLPMIKINDNDFAKQFDSLLRLT